MIVLISAELAFGCADLFAPTPCPCGDPKQAETLEKARTDFNEALARQTAGDWVGALALLRRVAEAHSTPQVRFNIAFCEEFLGRLSAARGHYIQTAQDARKNGAEDVAAQADRRAAALLKRTPIVVVHGATPPGSVVALDGVELGQSMLETPMPIDPGDHVVTVTEPGKPPWQTTFTAAERQRKFIDLENRTPSPTPGPTPGPT